MNSAERDKRLGRRIVSLREARCLSPKDLAKKLGIAAAVLGSKERGERSFKLEELVLLTDIFHMSLEELVNETPVDYLEPEDLGISEEVVQSLRVFREKHPEGMESINSLLAYPGFLNLVAAYVETGELPNTGDPNAPIEVSKAEDGLYNCKMTPLQYKKTVELALVDLLRKAKAEYDEAVR